MSQDKTDQQRSSPGKSKGLYVCIVAAVIVIIALVVVVACLLSKRDADTADTETQGAVPDSRATILTTENMDEVLAKAAEPVVAGTYYCSMNTEWHFEDSSSPSYDAYVANSVDNSYTVYFDVFLEDTEQLVYSSPYMEVGAELDELTLTEKLDAGEYPAIVTYHLVDDQHETLSTVSVAVTLFVEK
jgi:hypothetical protein